MWTLWLSTAWAAPIYEPADLHPSTVDAASAILPYDLVRLLRTEEITEVRQRADDGSEVVRWRGQLLFHGLRHLSQVERLAVWAVLGSDHALGAEADLMLPEDDLWVPASLWRDRAVVVVQRGSPRSDILQPGPSAEALMERFGIGPLVDVDVSWTPISRGLLEQGLELLTEEELAYLEGVAFERSRRASAEVVEETGLTDPAAAYHIDDDGPVVSIYDAALEPGFRSVGPVDRPSHPGLLAVLHEIGHAVAFAPSWAQQRDFLARVEELERRGAAYNERVRRLEADKASLDERGLRFNDRVDRLTGGGSPFSADARAATDADVARLREIERELSAEVARYNRELDVLAEEHAALQALDREVRERHAALLARDEDALLAVQGWSERCGSCGPTPYGRTSAGESFAEAFMLWKLDPEALERVLPGAGAWFASGAHLP